MSLRRIDESSGRNWFVWAAGAAALLVVIVRATIQSITIDEADTYLVFVARPSPSHWFPAANNHVLNSLLMRLSAAVFPPSALTMRLPAVFGALIYISASGCLARCFPARRTFQSALFVSLVFCPFIMDYLVAARGYSLALAFLMSSIAVAGCWMRFPAEVRLKRRSQLCAAISVCASLSFCANFSFAVADLSVAVGLFLWICDKRPVPREIAAFIIPGALVTFGLVGPTLWAWPKGELTWGARSFAEMRRSFVDASLSTPNPYLLNPWMLALFELLRRVLVRVAALCLLCRVIAIIWEARSRHAERDWTDGLGLVAAAAIAVSLSAHLLAHRLWALPLPLNRTALFFFPLLILLMGCVGAAPAYSTLGRVSAQAVLGVLLAFACYFFGCLRLTYFEEWKFDAQAKALYETLAHYNHVFGITMVTANWRYQTTLNCYMLLSGKETLADVTSANLATGEYAAGFDAYVLYFPTDQGFIEKHALKVTYYDPFTEAAVAVPSDSAAARAAERPHRPPP